MHMNEKDARAYAAANNLKATKRVKNADGSQVMTVGSQTIRHDGRGGSGCFYVVGDVYNAFGETRQRTTFIGETIRRAVMRELGELN